MNKAGSNASWKKLPPAARQKLESWLLDDDLGYQDVLERARLELNYTGSISSLRRFYSRCAHTRVMDAFTESAKQAQEIEHAHATTEQLRNASLKVMAQ